MGLGTWALEKLGFFRHNKPKRLPTNPPKPYWPPKPPISLYPRVEQYQSPLFGKISTELRIIIYEAVLGDPIRPMHVIPYDDQSNRVGRRRCKDMECPYPTWQHKCFGSWIGDRFGRVRQYTFNTNDRLLALLLSCRMIYSETIDILYTANNFSLKGARGLLAMQSVVPTPQWHMIRYLQLSTVFFTPKKWWLQHRHYPPENFTQWSDACQAIQSMRGLHSLRFEISVWNTLDRNNFAEVDAESLMSILEPLNDIKAPLFEVEINFSIPKAVQSILGETSFTLFVKERPYNERLFTP